MEKLPEIEVKKENKTGIVLNVLNQDNKSKINKAYGACSACGNAYGECVCPKPVKD